MRVGLSVFPWPGRLAPFADGFRQELAGLGYRSGYGLLERMAELSAWMSSEGLESARGSDRRGVGEVRFRPGFRHQDRA